MGRTRRVTLREAADILGVSKEAVRKRVLRGTLPSDTGEDGRRYVYVDEGPTTSSPEVGLGSDPRDQLIAQLRDEVEAWREESRRKDHIIAGLVERLPPALEAPESPETAFGPPARGRPPEEAQEAARGLLRGWWRKRFGLARVGVWVAFVVLAGQAVQVPVEREAPPAAEPAPRVA